MKRFRNEAARDRAWARYYDRQGLRGVVGKHLGALPNNCRIANYLLRRAEHQAARFITTTSNRY